MIPKEFEIDTVLLWHDGVAVLHFCVQYSTSGIALYRMFCYCYDIILQYRVHNYSIHMSLHKSHEQPMKLYYGVVYVQYSAQTLACFMYSTVPGSYRWFKPGFNEIMPAQSKIPAAPWELPTFQRSPTSKKDYWNVMQDWVVRMHGHSRAQPFQPLHSTFPLHRDAGEHIDSQRVTVAFFEGMDTPMVFQDSWTHAPTPETRARWKSRGKWTGFTFFHRVFDTNAVGQNKGSKHEGTVEVENDINHEAADHVAERFSHMTVGKGYARGGAKERGKACFDHGDELGQDDSTDGFELVEDQ